MTPIRFSTLKDRIRLTEPAQILTWTIPAGFETDGMSLPWFLWPLGGKFRIRTLRAALVHDYLYSIGVDRRYADQIFRNVLMMDGVRGAQFYYIGVRLFGGRYWCAKDQKAVG